MAEEQRKRLGDILLQEGFINESQLEKALQLQKTEGKRLAELLLAEGLITEENMLLALERQLKISLFDIRQAYIDPEIPKTISESIARKYISIPVKRENNVLTVATNDPLNIFAVGDIKALSGCDIKLVLDKKTNILNAIDKYYGKQNAEKAMEDFSLQLNTRVNQSFADLESAEIANAPVVRLVDSIIQQAVTLRASDIHIEPLENEIKVRFRTDGILQEVMRIPKNAQAAVTSRIKLIAGMEIAEKRLPQDGRYETEIC